jgi:hypothetical protein
MDLSDAYKVAAKSQIDLLICRRRKELLSTTLALVDPKARY